MATAELYGRTHQHPVSANQTEAECMVCGAKMIDQRESAMYECERCMNSHAE